MSQLLTPFYLIAITLVGVADTFYLAYTKFLNVTPSCLLKGCDVVLASKYSSFFGVFLGYWGLVFYVYMLALAILLALEPRSRMLTWAVVLYTGVGLVMSGAFIYIQGALIGAFCQYCLLSSATTVALFCVALWHMRSANTPAPER